MSKDKKGYDVIGVIYSLQGNEIPPQHTLQWVENDIPKSAQNKHVLEVP